MKAVIYEQRGVISPTKAAQLARLIVGYAQAHPEMIEKDDNAEKQNKDEARQYYDEF